MDSQFLLEFLNDHIDIQKPLALAYSGGADSESLYQLLLEIHQGNPLQLYILHVNHNWREESLKQANWLEKKVKQDGLAFYRKDLDPPSITSNLEEKGRFARLQFFQEMSKKHSLQAVLLAHHRDDLAETVLKKVLEGAHLINIPSLKPLQMIDHVVLLRPLLNITKQDLKIYLAKKKVSYLEDPTNVDTKYLRSRLRHQILPQLSRDFGKSVTNNLIELSNRCDELSSYFEQKIPHPEKKTGPLGDAYDCKKLQLTHLFEWKMLVLRILKEKNVTFSKEIIISVAKFLSRKAINKTFNQGKIELVVDRGILFILKKKLEPFTEQLPLDQGAVFWGPVRIEKSPQPSLETENMDWQALWKGEVSIYLPKGKHFLVSYLHLHLKDKKQVQKKRSEQKVPVFLRKSPVIVSEDGHLIGDLLSCRARINSPAIVKIKLEIAARSPLDKKLKV